MLMVRKSIGKILMLLIFSIFVLGYFSPKKIWHRKQITISPVSHVTTHPKINITTKGRIKPETTTMKYDWDAAAARFEKRLKVFRKGCQNVSPRKTWNKNKNFLVDVPRRFLMCAVFKSGSTTWYRIFWALRRKRRNLSTDDQKYYTSDDTTRNQAIAAHLSQEDGLKLINISKGDDNFYQKPPEESGYRMILARHPFARFISGWNQKFLLNSNYWVNMMKSYRSLIYYKKKIILTHVMAFEDFASYAAENIALMRVNDAHFQPATYLCRACEYDYTYILKAESFDADEPWLKRRLGIEDIGIRRRGIPPGGSVVNGDVKNNIKKYMSMLKPDIIKKLYSLYEQDFEYFGYTFNFTTLEAGGFD